MIGVLKVHILMPMAMFLGIRLKIMSQVDQNLRALTQKMEIFSDLFLRMDRERKSVLKLATPRLEILQKWVPNIMMGR